MKLSSKSQYAVQGMMKLALNFNDHAVTLNEITDNQNISLSYVEQLLSMLRTAGLVKGVRGPGGGYRLSRHPRQINMAQIILSVETSLSRSQDQTDPNDKNREAYLANHLWDQFSQKLLNYLASITLADVMKDHMKVSSQFQVDEKTRRISTMFPVSKDLKVA